MNIAQTNHENGIEIIVSDRLDAATTPELEAFMVNLLESASTNIIFNLSNLEYISSAGLRIVLSSAKNAKSKDLEIVLSSLQGKVKDVFEMSGFMKMFRSFDSTEAALEQM